MRGLLYYYAQKVSDQSDIRTPDLFGGSTINQKGALLDEASEMLGKSTAFAETDLEKAANEASTTVDDLVDEVKQTEKANKETQDIASTPDPLADDKTPAWNGVHGEEMTSGPPLEESALEHYLTEVDPLLSDIGGRMQTDFKTPGPEAVPLPDHAVKPLNDYLSKIGNDLNQVKYSAVQWAEARRNFSLLDYRSRTNAGSVMDFAFPYRYWYTSNMVNWMLRAGAHPEIVANYVRLNKFLSANIDRPGYPSRLSRKMAISAPWLPDWLGDSIYIDPLRQFYPMEQLLRPVTQVQEQGVLQMRRTMTNLDKMVQDEDITEQAYADAKKNQSGSAWDTAWNKARSELSAEIENPWDFAFSAIGPSLPISTAYNLAMGRGDELAPLPITKMIQRTSAAITGGEGINIGKPFRKMVGLPELPKNYYWAVDSVLSNMAVEGYDLKEIKLAMTEHKGELYDIALKRSNVLQLSKYLGAPIGVDFFPEGEKEQRSLQLAYNDIMDTGSSEAKSKFFDEHPEITARWLSFDDPEERLRSFLRGEIWESYNKLNAVDKRLARDQLGTPFTDLFINKETRNYDDLDTETMATWAKSLRGTVPGQVDVPSSRSATPHPRSANRSTVTTSTRKGTLRHRHTPGYAL